MGQYAYGRGAAGASSRPLVRNWLETQPSTPLGVRTWRQVTPSATRSGPTTITGVESATMVRVGALVDGCARSRAPAPPVPLTVKA